MKKILVFPIALLLSIIACIGWAIESVGKAVALYGGAIFNGCMFGMHLLTVFCDDGSGE